MQLNSGTKVWLWIVLVINVLSFVRSIPTYISFGGILYLSMILQLALIAGIALLLFAQKKIGFFLCCACALVAFILNVILGVNIIVAIVSAVVMPTITFLFLKNQWNELR